MQFDNRPIGYAHIPQVLIRFARQQAGFLRTSNLLVEFWKHCLNLVQYGIIDAECLAFCMKLVKGEDQWSSVSESEWGIGLAGPLALDTRVAPSLSPKNKDSMDVDRIEERSKGKERKPVDPDSGFCVCGRPFDKPEMIICNGSVSGSFYCGSCSSVQGSWAIVAILALSSPFFGNTEIGSRVNS
jgi:hypothetical protein